MSYDQQAKLREYVRAKIPRGKVASTARNAGIAETTLGNFVSGATSLGELSAKKLSKILGPEIELLFYNDGHEPAKGNTKSESEEERARKNYALREIERIGDGISDLGEQEKFWDVVLATSRAFGDASARGAKAKRGDGDVAGGAVRGGGDGSRKGAEAGGVSGEG